MSAGLRWVRFNAVGLAGFVVQTAILSALVRWTGLAPWMAVALAVLITVSHNFAWHERVTWPNQPPAGRLRRWVAFQASNGAISMVVNVGLTTTVARATGLSIVTANALAVGVASLATFLVSDRLVFRQ
jgi:putative flippase GtrA